ncbi:MAG: hypothetical protein QOG15_1045 [Solirubrobacteraceae bacterium]|jgi:hypothetical protein|nr:hypothetical protein [Solirubrobacteraceae bacterium]
MSALIASAQSDTIGIIFSWVVLLPGLATALIIVAMVAAKGEKAQDERLMGRWGRRPKRSDD